MPGIICSGISKLSGVRAGFVHPISDPLVQLLRARDQRSRALRRRNLQLQHLASAITRLVASLI